MSQMVLQLGDTLTVACSPGSPALPPQGAVSGPIDVTWRDEGGLGIALRDRTEGEAVYVAAVTPSGGEDGAGDGAASGTQPAAQIARPEGLQRGAAEPGPGRGRAWPQGGLV